MSTMHLYELMLYEDMRLYVYDFGENNRKEKETKSSNTNSLNIKFVLFCVFYYMYYYCCR